MKKNRNSCLFIIISIILIIFCCIYQIRTTNNFFMGSNTFYYRDIFNYPETEWICEKAGIELKVYDLQQVPLSEFQYVNYPRFATMKIEIDGEAKEFIMMGERGHIEIYEPYFIDGEYVDMPLMFRGFANYKKSFFTKDVNSFVIYNIIEDEIFNYKYKKLKFYKK